MSYLNLDLDYFSHPKTVRLVGLLGRGAEVLPIRLWCYCGKYHVESGKLTGYSAQEIESAVAWWGKPGELVEAMIRVGFLEEHDGEYGLHDWQEHEGHLAFFKERAKTAAAARWGRSNATSNASRHKKHCPLPTVPTNHNSLKTSTSEPPPEALGLAERLKTRILANNPTAKVPESLEAWAKTADLMIRLDKRSIPTITQVMDFSQSDVFWKANILSMAKLREKFDQLWMKMQSLEGGKNGGKPVGFAVAGVAKYQD